MTTRDGMFSTLNFSSKFSRTLLDVSVIENYNKEYGSILIYVILAQITRF